MNVGNRYPARQSCLQADTKESAASGRTAGQLAAPNSRLCTTGIVYDVASRQSRIPFAVRRKRETGLPSFGQRLKQEREKRKITLEQISVSTKIGTRMLQALEEGNFSQLPGGIFNKGFVRAYSRFVGLDEDQTVAEYLEASGDAPPVPAEPGSLEDPASEIEENVSRETSAAPARQLPWGWFAALLLVVALALSFWNHRRREYTGPSVPPTPTTTATPSTGSPTGGSARSVAPKISQALAPAVPAATPGEFTIVIQAREDSWISITADNRTASSELLLAGGERTVQGRKEVIVRAGNAGGIDFRLNGNKIATGGESGEVRTFTFGPQGILPNAPAPPSTP